MRRHVLELFRGLGTLVKRSARLVGTVLGLGRRFASGTLAHRLLASSLTFGRLACGLVGRRAASRVRRLFRSFTAFALGLGTLDRPILLAATAYRVGNAGRGLFASQASPGSAVANGLAHFKRQNLAPQYILPTRRRRLCSFSSMKKQDY